MIVPYGDIAKELADAINARSWSIPFAAEKRYAPLFRKSALADLHCSVIPGPVDVELVTVGRSVLNDVSMVVVFEQNVSADSVQDLDDLTALVFEVFGEMSGVDMPTNPPAQWVSGEVLSPFDDEQLAGGLFLAAFKFDFRVETKS